MLRAVQKTFARSTNSVRKLYNVGRSPIMQLPKTPSAKESEPAVAAAVPTGEAVSQTLDKILASSPFHHAESQKAFLRYVVNETLAGRGDQLKEYTIGVEVFQRKETYDPRYDNTVRLKAQKLRWSLAKYYEAEGKDDPVCIGFRSRSYQPVFSFRPPTRPAGQNGVPFDEYSQGEVIPIAGGERAHYSVVPEALLNVPPAKTSTGRRWLIWGSAVAFFLCSVSVAYLAGARHLPVSAGQKINSIAVLPLRTLGGDSEFLSSGLTADLTDSLARIPGMGVIAPSSASIYKGRAVDVREVGSRLNVRAVLDGSIQQVGNRVRINLLMSDTSNGLPLWSATYDQDVKDIFQTQTDVSDTVTNAVRLRLADAPAPQLESANVETAGMGAGESHARLGEAYAIDFQWSRADPEFRKALELSPTRFTVRRTYANYLQKVGRLSDAEAQIRQDPYTPSAVTIYNLAKNLYFGRRYKEAVTEYQSAIKIYEPVILYIHADLGLAYVFAGMAQKGIEELEFAHRNLKVMASFSGQLGYAYAMQGRTEDANRILSELLSRSDLGDSLSTAIAQVYIGLGNKDRAFDWLNKAVMQRDGNLFLKVDPIYDSLRNDSRFGRLLHSINLN
jgi:TolB-like protein/Tfp pilus assembly protein PilF